MATFPEGIWINKKHPAAPEYIQGSLDIDPEVLYQWAKNNQKKNGKVTLDIKLSKQDKLYLQVNEWEKDGDH